MHSVNIVKTVAALAVLVAAASPALAATYKLTPLIIKPAGEFTPVGISDTDVVPGTYHSAGGSTVGYAYTTLKGYMFNDFCGNNGAADNTVDTAMSPYSTTEFIAGDCGNGKGFSYNLQTAAITSVVYPTNGATYVNGINGGGLLVGTFLNNSFVYHGFYQVGSIYVAFDPPGSYGTFPAGINVDNTMYGMYQTSNPSQSVADSGFLLDEYGNYTTITVPGAARTAVTALNGNNIAVGNFYATDAETSYQQAFAYISGFYYGLPARNLLDANVTSVNESGIAAGTYQLTNGDVRGFVWNIQAGSIIPIKLPKGAYPVQVNGINNSNVVTGSYFNGNTSHWVAFTAACTGTGCF